MWSLPWLKKASHNHFKDISWENMGEYGMGVGVHLQNQRKKSRFFRQFFVVTGEASVDFKIAYSRQSGVEGKFDWIFQVRT